jgi:DNA-binding PadR family transcriptional regulator
MSGGVFRLTLGALYPALQRLERRGHVKGSWSTSDNNRRARYYTLTPAGRRRLATGQKSWERMVAAMIRVLGTETA